MDVSYVNMANTDENVSRRWRLEKKKSINLDPSVLAMVVRTRKLGVNQKEDVTMVYFDSLEIIPVRGCAPTTLGLE
jgi:hypothetical protein